MTLYAVARTILEEHGWRRTTEARGAFETRVTLLEALGLARRGADTDVADEVLTARLETLLGGPALVVWHDAHERTATDVVDLLGRAMESCT